MYCIKPNWILRPLWVFKLQNGSGVHFTWFINICSNVLVEGWENWTLNLKKKHCINSVKQIYPVKTSDRNKKFWPPLNLVPKKRVGQVTNPDFKSNIFKKWFLRLLLFYTTFLWGWKIKENTKKHLWRSYKDFGMYNI